MKYALIITCCFAVSVSWGQEIVRTEYTRYDQIRVNSSAFLSGEKEEIKFNMIGLRNLTTNEAIYGVEVELKRREKEAVGGSLAFGFVSSFWGGSASVSYRNINQAGYILLTPSDVDTVLAFLNGIIGVTGQEHPHMKVYKISLRERFELGMAYDPKISNFGVNERRRLPRWKFIFTVDGVAYTMDYEDGIQVLQKLSAYSRQLQELISSQ